MKTGIAPISIIGLTVVGKHAAVVMTSSPLFILLSPSLGEVRHFSAIRLADDPEFIVSAKFMPKRSLSFFSNKAFHLPSVHHPSREHSTRFCSSFSS